MFTLCQKPASYFSICPVKVGVEDTCFKPLCILKETTKPADLFETMPQKLRYPGKGY